MSGHFYVIIGLVPDNLPYLVVVISFQLVVSRSITF